MEILHNDPSMVYNYIFSTFHDMCNSTMWFPEHMRDKLHTLPPDYPHWTDLKSAIYIWAPIITLIRLFLIKPIFAHLGKILMKIDVKQTEIDKMSIEMKQQFDKYESFRKSKKQLSKMSPIKKIQYQQQLAEKWNKIQNAILSTHKMIPSELNSKYTVYKTHLANKLKLKKFTESGWRLCFYSFIWIYGIYALKDEPYFFGPIRYMWKAYPYQRIWDSTYWYYILSLAHYIHLTAFIMIDVKRKDFYEQLIHHIVTIILIEFSWAVNMSAIGSVVLFLHDGSDILLEAAKLFNYCGWKNFTDGAFVLFALSFFVCRIIILPYRVMYTVLFDTGKEVGIWFPYYFFNGFLFALYALHVFWMSIIAKMAIQFCKGNLKNDARSDSEAESDTEAEPKSEQQLLKEPKKDQ